MKHRLRREASPKQAHSILWKQHCKLLLAVTLVAACSQQPTTWRVAERFITDDPALLHQDDFITRTEVVRWPTDGDGNSWRAGPKTELRATGKHLVVRSKSEIAWIERDVHFDAASVDTITVTTRGSKKPTALLEWASADTPFSHDQRSKASRWIDTKAGESTYQFTLGNEAGWRGRVARIRLGLGARDRDSVIDAVAAWTVTTEPPHRAVQRDNTRRATLDDETRSVLLAWPGFPIIRDLVPHAGASLRFGLGIDPRTRETITFAVSATPKDGPTTTIFEARLTPGTSSWHDATVDLSSFANQPVRLELTVSSPQDNGPHFELAYWAHPEIVVPTSTKGPPPPNVVLISVDTLRADHLSLYGYPRPTSPNLDAWAAEAAVFETAVAAAPWTLPSHVSMLSGLDAAHHGVNYQRAMPAHIQSLAETLHRLGLATGAVTAGGYLHPTFGMAQGFDRFRFFNSAIGNRKELKDGIKHSLAWLDDHRDRPFFFFFHTYETHLPYVPRQPWFKQFSPHNRPRKIGSREVPPRAEDGYLHRHKWFFRKTGPSDKVRDIPPAQAKLPRDLYDAAIAYADHHLGRLLDYLETTGLAKRTIVVVTSDHGEMIGEHGVFNHLYLYDENLLIPLLIHDPAGRGAGRRISQQVRTVDIVPTVRALVGLDPEPTLDGVSLVPLLEGRPLAVPPAWSYAAGSNWGLSLRMRNRFKYVFKNAAWPMPSVDREALFDLRTGESALPADAQQLAPFRTQADTLFARRHPGLRVLIRNDKARRLRGFLAGPAVGSNRVKRAATDDCDCIEKAIDNRLRFRVPRSREVTLALEDVPDAPLLLGLRYPNGEISKHEIDVATLAEGFSVSLQKGTWASGARIDNLKHGVTIWWQGPETANPPTPENEALREQLEALGYLGGDSVH